MTPGAHGSGLMGGDQQMPVKGNSGSRHRWCLWKMAYSVQREITDHLILVAAGFTVLGLGGGLLGLARFVIGCARTAPVWAQWSLAIFVAAGISLVWSCRAESRLFFGDLKADERRPTQHSWRRRRTTIGLDLFLLCLAAPGSVCVFGRVGLIESAFLFSTASLSCSAFLLALDRDAGEHVDVRHRRDQILSLVTLEVALSSFILFFSITAVIAGAATGPRWSPHYAKTHPSTLPRHPQPPIAKPVPTTTTTVPQEPPDQNVSACLIAPGDSPAIPASIRTAMIVASHQGASPAYGCLEPVQVQSDGSFLQRLSKSPAILIGSSEGAGVVNALVANDLNFADGEEASDLLASLGGQPLDLVPCFSDQGDFQPFVSTGSKVVGLFGRAVTSDSPIMVAPAVLPAFAAELILDKTVLAPVGPAVFTQGGVTQQSFVDPLSGQSVVLTSEDSGIPLTADELWNACNPGLVAPSWLDGAVPAK